MKYRLTAVRLVVGALLLGTASLIVAGQIFAHAVVHPGEVRAGAYEKFVLRVPNERDTQTVRVELAFPGAVRVVSFADVPGWNLEVTSGPDRGITRAIWTGTLPVQRFVEFPFVAVTPESETRLQWDAVQTYADGERVEWAGPEGSATPASFTVVKGTGASGPDRGTILGALALVLALLALGLVLRTRTGNVMPGPPPGGLQRP